MTTLKLLALDEEDLQVVSSQLQDAVVRVGDMTYLPSQKRFAAVVNRFDWQSADRDGERYRRLRTALRFDRVLGARHKDLAPADKDRVLSLLAIGFEAGEDPSGKVVLYFAGDVTVQLDVECIEAEMRDLGPAWRTRNKPEHPGEGEGNGQNDANEPAGSNPNGSEAADA
ncbi:MAG: DUF2948 family protein [Methyloceanibacter sp.]|jgi:hypothetical protein|uniref:DUF2948 family protein n=1 Tax=Methyloceanibacter sp. TaxID=1965321 RepID=UPI003C34DA1E